MKKVLPSVTALLAALLLVVAYDAVTYAQTGSSLLLGKINKSSTVTTLARTTSGPALSLKTKSGAPLAVSSSTKVARLNADKVDGMDASKLQTVVRTWNVPETSTVSQIQVTLPGGVAPGRYLVTYAVGGDAGGSGVECVVRTDGPGMEIHQYAYATGMRGGDGDFGVSGTAPITVVAGDNITLHCSAITNTFSIKTVTKSNTISFVPVNAITTKAAIVS